METAIKITTLNDFVFCPASVYFHNLYADVDKTLYQCSVQINGTQAHKTVDTKTYRVGEKALTGIAVYCEQYHLIGKIDLYYPTSGKLVERKKKIKTIYDGYIFQLYGQYFAMTEMGYPVKSLLLRSVDDNKSYPIPLPSEDTEMYRRFEETVEAIRSYDLFAFQQTNPLKCQRCIYEPMCDRSEKDAVKCGF